MDDRIAVKVIDELGDALFQLVFRVDADVAEHGASGFGEEPLDEVQPGTVLRSEDELETSLGSGGEPGLGFARDVGGVIVEDDLDRGRDGVGGIEGIEKLDEFATAMTIPDQRVHLTREQVDAGHQRHRSVALVLVIAADCGMDAGNRRQIGSRRADRLDSGFLVIRDDGELARVRAATGGRGCQLFCVSKSRETLYVVEGITNYGTSDQGRGH